MGERTGSRVLCELWSYVKEEEDVGVYVVAGGGLETGPALILGFRNRQSGK
jgi:hypothetical protein